MGFRICYIAAQMSLKDVVEGLSLELGAETNEQPFDYDWIGHQPETGFTILWSDDEGYAFRQQGRLAALSKNGMIYSAQINETAMCSDAVCFRGGKEFWRVMYQGFDGPSEANATSLGAVIPEFQEELDKQRQAASKDAHNNVDYFFDVPINILEKKIGFRYDQVMKLSKEMKFFEVAFKPEIEARKGFWSKIFKR